MSPLDMRGTVLSWNETAQASAGSGRDCCFEFQFVHCLHIAYWCIVLFCIHLSPYCLYIEMRRIRTQQLQWLLAYVYYFAFFIDAPYCYEWLQEVSACVRNV